jgi:hypothetical protein
MKKQEDFMATVCEAVAMVEPQTERAELSLFLLRHRLS